MAHSFSQQELASINSKFLQVEVEVEWLLKGQRGYCKQVNNGDKANEGKCVNKLFMSIKPFLNRIDEEYKNVVKQVEICKNASVQGSRQDMMKCVGTVVDEGHLKMRGILEEYKNPPKAEEKDPMVK